MQALFLFGWAKILLRNVADFVACNTSSGAVLIKFAGQPLEALTPCHFPCWSMDNSTSSGAQVQIVDPHAT